MRLTSPATQPDVIGLVIGPEAAVDVSRPAGAVDGSADPAGPGVAALGQPEPEATALALPVHPPAQAEQTRRLFIGAGANAIGHALRLALQIFLLPVLARLLAPEAYGAIAFVVPIILFASLISDAGLEGALVRGRHVTPTDESTVFWTSSGMGLLLAVLLCFASGPIAAASGLPAVGPLLIGLSPVLMLASLCTVPVARLLRQGRAGLLAVGNTVGLAVSAVVVLYGAYNGWGAWSLVAQQIALWICKFVAAVLLSRTRVRLVFDVGVIRRLLGFGFAMAGANMLEFVTRNLDNVLVGALLGAEGLGYYAMAYQLMRMPDLLLSGPVFLSIFPAIARAADHPAAVTRIYLGSLRMVTLLVAPLMIGLVVTADLAVPLILGARWAPAGPVLAILALGGLAQSLFPLNAALLLGLGRAGLQLRIAGIVAVLAISGMLVGAQFSITGVACGVTVGIGIAALPSFGTASRSAGIGTGQVLAVVFPPLLGAAAMAMAVLLLRGALAEQLAGWPLLLVCIGGGALTYAAVVLPICWRQLRDGAALLRGRTPG